MTLFIVKQMRLESDSSGHTQMRATGDSFATDSDPDSPDFIDECVEQLGPLQDNEMFWVSGPNEDDHCYFVSDNTQVDLDTIWRACWA